jgi:hypothetical protein
MEPYERVKMIEEYHRTRGEAYCSYAMGMCAHGNNVLECAKRNPVECRLCRQQAQAAQ